MYFITVVESNKSLIIYMQAINLIAAVCRFHLSQQTNNPAAAAGPVYDISGCWV